MFKRFVSSRFAMAIAAPVVVTIPTTSLLDKSKDSTETPAHHTAKGFVNPWPSFVDRPTTIKNLWQIYQDWQSSPTPPPELLPQVLKPKWGLTGNAAEDAKWKEQIKSTWLGHACFLVEFPAPPGSTGRGARVLFDPVFSNRCSPSQIMGHNHYDHTDVTTLKHIYKAQQKGTVHFFAPQGNAKWFKSIGFSSEHVTELDWWYQRDLSITLPGDTKSDLRITCTPCQHFTGRSLTDRNETLWASWAVNQLPSPSSSFKGSVWFAGDTGFKSVPRGATTEEGLPTCPVFKEIGDKFGGFDFAMIPIGAYDPRYVMSRVHCSPEDAVQLHLDTKSKKSVGMHWGTWILTSEEMTEPPKRLRAACEKEGITKEQFGVCDIGETILIDSSRA
ncbi:N-acyl-phosphatidylethanolamine-hydrolyzing phospholipase D [Pseudohyphozyma bogoriensis]|nr:N-acyl-phosphatidylethanolamine-hydrolyzing phospholipase D [Pseudohyphozyma bogoriensis]